MRRREGGGAMGGRPSGKFKWPKGVALPDPPRLPFTAAGHELTLPGELPFPEGMPFGKTE